MFRTLKKKVFLPLFMVYLWIVNYALFNFKSHCIFTEPKLLIPIQTMTQKERDELCKIEYDSLGVVNLDMFSEPTLNEIMANNPHVIAGGKWEPVNCKSYQKVAIIIPYRNRMAHLKMLINRIHTLLRRQKIYYQVFVIEQYGDDFLNRGKLRNVGFLEAMKLKNFDCFIFHDVDLIPEHDGNLYMCDDNIRQLSSAIDEWRYHIMYYNNAGGVVALKTEKFKILNGYANSYWGWGNEDDDLSARAHAAGLLLTRPPEHIGRFKAIKHKKSIRDENAYANFIGWRGRWMLDGLNNPENMAYEVEHFSESALYTNITVNIGPSAGHMIDPSKDTTKESFWWFLTFYVP